VSRSSDAVDFFQKVLGYVVLLRETLLSPDLVKSACFSIVSCPDLVKRTCFSIVSCTETALY
jgi:hypothetical protein